MYPPNYRLRHEARTSSFAINDSRGGQGSSGLESKSAFNRETCQWPCKDVGRDRAPGADSAQRRAHCYADPPAAAANDLKFEDAATSEGDEPGPMSALSPY